MLYYYYQEREERGLQKDIAISRVEQVFPFPYDMLSEDLARHPNAEVCGRQLVEIMLVFSFPFGKYSK